VKEIWAYGRSGYFFLDVGKTRAILKSSIQITPCQVANPACTVKKIQQSIYFEHRL
jgi:hypothetical protein